MPKAVRKKTRELTGKQKLFVQEYVANNMNASLAASLAGYKGNEITLANMGKENIRKPYVKAEIDKLLADRKKKTGYNREKAEAELEEIHNRALEKSDLASAVSAVKEKKKLFGLDQEEKTLNINVKPIVSPIEERAQLTERLKLLDAAEGAGNALVDD